jgi:D-beta-D-heptose 7-phosphate kinase/D-beta-D-heptose 1-phosphate adenosyltransferase
MTATATTRPEVLDGGRPRVVVLGDVVLDRDVLGTSDRLAPDAPVPVVEVREVRETPGGAGLTALAAAASGMSVTLVAPIAADDAGIRLLAALRRRVSVVPLGHEGPTRTKTRVWSRDHQLLRFDTGGTGRPVDADLEEVARELAAADVVLVSDYGAGVSRDEGLRALIAEVAGRVPVVWDPHPRGGAPVPGVGLVTPNLAEARTSAGVPDGTADELAGILRDRWQVGAVAVTAGPRGAFVADRGSAALAVPAERVTGGDPSGAGDRFAASAAAGLARGLSTYEAVAVAVADATAWVGGGGTAFREALGFSHGPDGVLGGGLPEELTGGAPIALSAPPTEAPAPPAAGSTTVDRVVARIRATGGTLVATGGCFDLLHAGHVASLRAARHLGDALVVLLNSDDSVRRLKGPSRPTVGQDDRARVLMALTDVDGVVIFDEDDPRAALERLRPDIWVKGGDYAGRELPEAALVQSWGGRVILLPTLPGRSTTALLAAREAADV